MRLPQISPIVPLLALVACSAPRLVPTGAAHLQDVGRSGPLVVHPVYAPVFAALRDALEADDLAVARSTLARLRSRFERDLAVAPDRPQASRPTEGVTALAGAGDLPMREHVEAARSMADGFERVIEGRVRLATIDLEVELRRVPDEEQVHVSLVARSKWHAPLTLRSGLGVLDILRTSLEPHRGIERRETQRRSLRRPVELEIPARGSARLAVTRLPIEVPVGVIATRMRVDLVLNGGSVQEADSVFPARRFAVGAGRRTDLAGWVPASIVEPEEIVRLTERGGAPVAALVERAVRIDPERHAETLDLLGRSARTLPVDAVEALVPSLRWLVGTDEFGRDAERWRQWLIERCED